MWQHRMRAGVHGVEIKQVQYFLAVARHDSLSAAAVSLGITQSAISTSLAALERELGATLVSRSAGRRGTTLTTAGRALLAPARSILDQVAAAREAVAATSTKAAGAVRVASCVVPQEYRVLQVALELELEHPEVTVSVITAGSGEVIRLVSAGSVDFGVAAVAAHEEPHLLVENLANSPLALVCRPDHRLAEVESVGVEDLAGERIVGYPRDQRPRQLMDQWMAQGSTDVAVTRVESGEPAVVLDLVRAGRGISYAPTAFKRENFGRGLVMVPLRQAPDWNLAVISRRGGPSTPAAVAVRQAYLSRCG